jgi:hypothetical protein
MSCLTASSKSSFLTLFKFISSSDPSKEKDVENIKEVFEDGIDENIVKTDDVEDVAEYGNEKIDVVVENTIKTKTGFMRILSTLLGFSILAFFFIPSSNAHSIY